jgi:hypothetical protein
LAHQDHVAGASAVHASKGAVGAGGALNSAKTAAGHGTSHAGIADNTEPGLGEEGPEQREPRPWMTGPSTPVREAVEPNVAPLHE